MSSSDELTDHARRNRAWWDAAAAEYQQQHGEFIGQAEPRWGVWQLPEAELQILGDVTGKDVLELGCGAGQWSILLAQRGARPTGLDNSAQQLDHARAAMAAAGVEFPLVHASAESVPLPDESFDVVFCDHGAFGWADPRLVMPEAARLLRPGGLLAFSITSPFATVCVNPDTDLVEAQLHLPYFGLHRLEEERLVNFQLPYGEWIGLFRAHGLEVLDLVEPPAPDDGRSTYWDERETDWARLWPSEAIWRARKR